MSFGHKTNWKAQALVKEIFNVAKTNHVLLAGGRCVGKKLLAQSITDACKKAGISCQIVSPQDKSKIKDIKGFNFDMVYYSSLQRTPQSHLL